MAAIALNLVSVVARAAAWERVIKEAMPPPTPPFREVFSAFGVGLFANAVLPGRIGELARVAVLTRHQDGAAQRRVGDARRHRLRTPGLRPLPGAPADRVRARDREDPALGADEPADLRRRRFRGLRVRTCERAAPSSLGARGGRERAAPRHDGQVRPRRHARPRARHPGRPASVRRLDLPAVRGLGNDARVRHPCAAPRGGARARADERGDALPALARERRSRAGRDRAAARLVRRGLSEGVRVRDRAPGDRDVGRRRHRLDLPGPRGALVRDAEANAGRGAGRGRAGTEAGEADPVEEPARARARLSG